MKVKHLIAAAVMILGVGYFATRKSIGGAVANVTVDKLALEPKSLGAAAPVAAPSSKQASQDEVVEIQTRARNWCDYKFSEEHLVLPKPLLKMVWAPKASYIIFSKEDLPCLAEGQFEASFYEEALGRDGPTYYTVDMPIKVQSKMEFQSLEEVNQYLHDNSLEKDMDVPRVVGRMSGIFPYFIKRPPLILAKIAGDDWKRSDYGVPVLSPLYTSLESSKDLENFRSKYDQANIVFLTESEDTKLLSGGALYLNVPANFHFYHINGPGRESADFAGLLKQFRTDEPILLVGQHAGDRSLETVAAVLKNKGMKRIFIYRPGAADLKKQTWSANDVSGVKSLQFKDVMRIFQEAKKEPVFVDVRPEKQREQYMIVNSISVDQFLKDPGTSQYIFLALHEYDPSLREALAKIPSEKSSQVKGFLRGGLEELNVGLWFFRLETKKKADRKMLKAFIYVGLKADIQNSRAGMRIKNSKVARHYQKQAVKPVKDYPNQIFLKGEQ